VTASAILAMAACAGAQPPGENEFLWNEANSELAASTTPPDFRRAARSYQALVDSGVRNGPLFYNLGTALLSAEMYNDAIEAFQRAERYLGAAPDLEANLQIARARKAGETYAPEPWYRTLLFWHYAWPCATRAVAAAVAFTAFWIGLTLRVLGISRMARPFAVAALALFVILGSSVATSLHQEATAPRPLFTMIPAGR
jgi:tetratricopeptide (TPR) repeat protein